MDDDDPTALRLLQTALDGDPATSLAQRLVDLAPEAFTVDGAGLSEILEPNVRRLVAATDPHAVAAEEVQLSLGEGPCLLAHQRAEDVLVHDLEAPPPELPVYARRLLAETPFRAAYCFPVSLGARRVGALDLYARKAGPFGGSLQRAHALAAYLAWSLIVESTSAGEERPWVDQAHDRWAHVHQAVGMVSEQLKAAPPVAFSLLRARAFTEGRSLADVAQDVIDGAVRLTPER